MNTPNPQAKIEDELSILMEYCKYNQEAKDRLSRISFLIKEGKKLMIDDEIEFLGTIDVFKGSEHPIDKGVHQLIQERLQKLNQLKEQK